MQTVRLIQQPVGVFVQAKSRWFHGRTMVSICKVLEGKELNEWCCVNYNSFGYSSLSMTYSLYVTTWLDVFTCWALSRFLKYTWNGEIRKCKKVFLQKMIFFRCHYERKMFMRQKIYRRMINKWLKMRLLNQKVISLLPTSKISITIVKFHCLIW